MASLGDLCERNSAIQGIRNQAREGFVVAGAELHALVGIYPGDENPGLAGQIGRDQNVVQRLGHSLEVIGIAILQR